MAQRLLITDGCGHMYDESWQLLQVHDELHCRQSLDLLYTYGAQYDIIHVDITRPHILLSVLHPDTLCLLIRLNGVLHIQSIIPNHCLVYQLQVLLKQRKNITVTINFPIKFLVSSIRRTLLSMCLKVSCSVIKVLISPVILLSDITRRYI